MDQIKVPDMIDQEIYKDWKSEREELIKNQAQSKTLMLFILEEQVSKQNNDIAKFLFTIVRKSLIYDNFELVQSNKQIKNLYFENFRIKNIQTQFNEKFKTIVKEIEKKVPVIKYATIPDKKEDPKISQPTPQEIQKPPLTEEKRPEPYTGNKRGRKPISSVATERPAEKPATTESEPPKRGRKPKIDRVTDNDKDKEKDKEKEEETYTIPPKKDFSFKNEPEVRKQYKKPQKYEPGPAFENLKKNPNGDDKVFKPNKEDQDEVMSAISSDIDAEGLELEMQKLMQDDEFKEFDNLTQNDNDEIKPSKPTLSKPPNNKNIQDKDESVQEPSENSKQEVKNTDSKKVVQSSSSKPTSEPNKKEEKKDDDMDFDDIDFDADLEADIQRYLDDDNFDLNIDKYFNHAEDSLRKMENERQGRPTDYKEPSQPEDKSAKSNIDMSRKPEDKLKKPEKEPTTATSKEKEVTTVKPDPKPKENNEVQEVERPRPLETIGTGRGRGRGGGIGSRGGRASVMNLRPEELKRKRADEDLATKIFKSDELDLTTEKNNIVYEDPEENKPNDSKIINYLDDL